MPPRITFTLTDGSLDIYLNPEGRDLLVRELQGLSERNDHVHFGPAEMEYEVPTRPIAYREGEVVVEWGKILFRPDEWDAKYYPHVLELPAEP
ncbi:MAG TPA: hypothetical protein PLV04_03315 [Phenylobacterium sp.]|nr:hypothetical protein [Phenylobacterium sp.]